MKNKTRDYKRNNIGNNFQGVSLKKFIPQLCFAGKSNNTNFVQQINKVNFFIFKNHYEIIKTYFINI